MKAMTRKSGGMDYLHKESRLRVRRSLKYFTVLAAEIMLDTFQAEKDTVVDFLYAVFEQYQSMDVGNVEIKEYADALYEDYGVTVDMKHKCAVSGLTDVAYLDRKMTDLCVKWIVQVMLIVLLDKFGFTVEQAAEFCDEIDKHIETFTNGADYDYADRKKRLKSWYCLDIDSFIIMGGETL